MMLFSESKFSSQSFACPGGSKLKHKCCWNSIIHGMSVGIFESLLWMPPNPKLLALLTGTQLPSFHSHKLVPTSDKSPESPTTSDRVVGTGRAGGAIDRSVNPISGRGADYALRNNTRPPGSQEIYPRSAPACGNGMMVIVFQSVGLTVLG